MSLPSPILPTLPTLPVSTSDSQYTGLSGLLPIYKCGSLKDFQRKGNYLNFKLGIIHAPQEKLLPFFSQYVDYNILNSISSFILYKLCPELLRKADTYDKLVAARIETTNLSTSLILNQEKASLGVERYYHFGNSFFPVDISKGIYELYFTDGANCFESEIFCIDNEIHGSSFSLKWDTTYYNFDTTLITFDNET